jgi:hypothetical protein
LAVPVLAHRVLSRSFLQGSRQHGVEEIVTRLVESVRVPT